VVSNGIFRKLDLIFFKNMQRDLFDKSSDPNLIKLKKKLHVTVSVFTDDFSLTVNNLELQDALDKMYNLKAREGFIVS